MSTCMRIIRVTPRIFCTAYTVKDTVGDTPLGCRYPQGQRVDIRHAPNYKFKLWYARDATLLSYDVLSFVVSVVSVPVHVYLVAKVSTTTLALMTTARSCGMKFLTWTYRTRREHALTARSNQSAIFVISILRTFTLLWLQAVTCMRSRQGGSICFALKVECFLLYRTIHMWCSDFIN